MNINCTFKNFEPSEHLKNHVRTRFVKLGKYVANPDDCELQVNLSVEKIRHQAEVTLDADNIHLSAFEESEDMYTTIDLVLDKMEARLRKMREKIKDRRRAKPRDVRFDVVSFSDVEGGGKAQFAPGEVHRQGQVGPGIDEGAVQIKDDAVCHAPG